MIKCISVQVDKMKFSAFFTKTLAVNKKVGLLSANLSKNQNN